MGATSSTSVVRIGDWEHEFCWMDAEDFQSKTTPSSTSSMTPSSSPSPSSSKSSSSSPVASAAFVRRSVQRLSVASTACLSSAGSSPRVSRRRRRRRKSKSDGDDLIEMSSVGSGAWNCAMDYYREQQEEDGPV